LQTTLPLEEPTLSSVFNAPGRIHRLYSAAAAQPDSANAAQAWAKVLGVEEDSEIQFFSTVASRLGALAEEVERAYLAVITGTPLTEDVYEPVFERLRRCLATHALNSSWKSFRVHLNGDLLRLLKTFSQSLPSDSREIPQELLTQIAEALEALSSLVSDPSLPPNPKRFLQQHLHMVTTALGEYPIRGDGAFDGALGQAVIQYPEFSELVAQEPRLKPLNSLWALVTAATAREATLERLASGDGLGEARKLVV